MTSEATVAVTLTVTEAQIVLHALDSALCGGQIPSANTAALRAVMRRLVPQRPSGPKRSDHDDGQ